MKLKALLSCCVFCLIMGAVGCGNQDTSFSSKLAPTTNAQVAAYTVSSNKPGKVAVQFGLDTTYGLTTWTQPVSQGGATTLLVAGMRANSTYHLRAVVQFGDGTRFVDSDHTFTTGPGDPRSKPQP
jgi:hypothetical protein